MCYVELSENIQHSAHFLIYSELRLKLVPMDAEGSCCCGLTFWWLLYGRSVSLELSCSYSVWICTGFWTSQNSALQHVILPQACCSNSRPRANIIFFKESSVCFSALPRRFDVCNKGIIGMQYIWSPLATLAITYRGELSFVPISLLGSWLERRPDYARRKHFAAGRSNNAPSQRVLQLLALISCGAFHSSVFSLDFADINFWQWLPEFLAFYHEDCSYCLPLLVLLFCSVLWYFWMVWCQFWWHWEANWRFFCFWEQPREAWWPGTKERWSRFMSWHRLLPARLLPANVL